ncbi:MAG: c-type cytochrome [Arenicellaceae bacterium]|nr:c-type cytochrome [Arenicellaceae bacterium]
MCCLQLQTAWYSRRLERGTYLMKGIAACGNCHTPKNSNAIEVEGMAYAGSFVIESPNFKAYAPNITMDIETGIGDWTDEEITRSIRDGIRPDGTSIGPPMPSSVYALMSGRDVKAIVSYLRTVEPVKNVVPKTEFKITLPSSYGPPVVTVPEVSKDDPIAYGRYLTYTLGHCFDCHTPLEDGKYNFDLIGESGRVFDNIFGLGFTTVSLNITPHKLFGLGECSDGEIKLAMVEGISRNGRSLVRAMAFPNYQKVTEEDINAIVAYLRSMKPFPAD